LKTNKLARRTLRHAAHFRLVNIAHHRIIPATADQRACLFACVLTRLEREAVTASRRRCCL
jgi:hypothetical protein